MQEKKKKKKGCFLKTVFSRKITFCRDFLMMGNKYLTVYPHAHPLLKKRQFHFSSSCFT